MSLARTEKFIIAAQIVVVAAVTCATLVVVRDYGGRTEVVPVSETGG